MALNFSRSSKASWDVGQSQEEGVLEPKKYIIVFGVIFSGLRRRRGTEAALQRLVGLDLYPCANQNPYVATKVHGVLIKDVVICRLDIFL